MSDKQVILNALGKVERRIRANRLLNDTSGSLVYFFAFLLAFKIADLIRPFRGWTVVPVVGIWFLAWVAYSLFLLQRKVTLEQAAVSVDQRLVLHDEIKSAYWFMDHAFPSDWVDGQIRRAAGSVRSIDVGRLYPGIFPKTSYFAAGILLLIVFLNFSPLSTNHNWFALQAAPAYTFTDREQALLEHVKDVLEGTGQSALAERLQKVVQQLQSGEISATKAIEQLAEIQNALEFNEEARQDLENLIEAMRQRQAAEEGLASGEQQGAGWTTPLPDGKGAANAPPGNEPFGLEPSGEFVPNPPRLGPPTTLRVQLEREQIQGQRDQELKETEASRQEASSVEYGNSESDFRPIPKDVMNREEIPWTYRPLIRNYFAMIQAPAKD